VEFQLTNSWIRKDNDAWGEDSIKLLLSICYVKPARIVISIKKDEKAWNPDGDDTIGPATITYIQKKKDITCTVERKEKKAKK